MLVYAKTDENCTLVASPVIFDNYEMAEAMGQPRSAWSGALNLLQLPSQTGFGRGRLFLSDEIAEWGDGQPNRISQLLAWITNSTNVFRPRRLPTVWANREQLDGRQLRHELDKASRVITDQAEWISTLEDGNTVLESELSDTRATLDDVEERSKKQTFAMQSLKMQLANATGRTTNLNSEEMLHLICRPDPPTPLECIEVIAGMYSDQCVILESAKDSARDMNLFSYGRRLLDMLRRLVTEYRSKLLDGGDNEARKVFCKNEYAAKESETVMGNKAMRRQRTFDYEGEPVEMFRHLKIGADENVTKTIRVYFHWDAERAKIVIGYCGEHFAISGH
jgi:hypothetical protein